MMPFIFRSHRALRGAFSNNAAGWRGRKKKGCSTLIFAHWRGQLYGRSESSEKVTGFSEISFFYLSPLPGLCVCLWMGARNKSWFWFTSNINLRVYLKWLGLTLPWVGGGSALLSTGSSLFYQQRWADWEGHKFILNTFRRLTVCVNGLGYKYLWCFFYYDLCFPEFWVVCHL